jgi:hypothetical protein
MNTHPPTTEHQWLKQLLGTWEIVPAPETPADQLQQGTETYRALGDFWVVGHAVTTFAEGGMENVVTLGFDPDRAKFVGTWVGSPMEHLWLYEGTLDADSNTLTLDSIGPDFFGGREGMIRYQDIVVLDGDRRWLRAQYEDENGVFQSMMETEYRRVN